MTQQKKKQVIIPIINAELEELLKKYDFTVPNVCEQIINRYIKDICHDLSETVPSLGVKLRTLLTMTERDVEKGQEIEI